MTYIKVLFLNIGFVQLTEKRSRWDRSQATEMVVDTIVSFASLKLTEKRSRWDFQKSSAFFNALSIA
tara:strand:- start:682 stop:882 length:201 start_codon:yes stop_codon:yes gene_type:complete